LNMNLIPTIIGNLKYSVLEYDYKYCKYRSPEKHYASEKTNCNCHNDNTGKLISAFYYGSMGTWWMSEKQKEKYLTIFPFLVEKTNTVLSSVFDNTTLQYIEKLAATSPVERKGWIVLGSDSWVKGASTAEKWCKDNNKEYEVVWNVPYHELLEKLSKAEGFVYLPSGSDTCPRMVIEAKLLGCKTVLNSFVQHKDESWFDTDDINSIIEYLSVSTGVFWTSIKHMMSYQPRISGYTTTYNAVKQEYPFEQSIKSMLEFCDEVWVVDGGSTDDTWERLMKLASQYVVQDTETLKFHHRLNLKQIPRDWSHPRHAVFDGMQKAEARKMCTGDFCWQMDSDEIVHEDDAQKIVEICRHIPREVDVLSLPVIEYWGSSSKVRADIQPWKWRLSRNKPNITHGIPVDLRKVDSEGITIAIGGTDGCDMIDTETGERLPHMSFYTPDIEGVRQAAMIGNQEALQQYENWFNSAVAQLPCVFHYSWHDMPRKIKLYRDYWQNHWLGLWDKDTSDSVENNMMFDCPWSEVSDKMIEDRAAELSSKLGGWIWHKKWDGVTTTPHITCNRTEPAVMSPYKFKVAQNA